MLPAGPPETAVPIDDRYETAAGPVVREQIERAGARLAAVLNADLK